MSKAKVTETVTKVVTVETEEEAPPKSLPEQSDWNNYQPHPGPPTTAADVFVIVSVVLIFLGFIVVLFSKLGGFILVLLACAAGFFCWAEDREKNRHLR
jgi:hypothetical protein